MFFFVYSKPVSCFSLDEFWNGSPLFLNITVILATVCLIAAVAYFLYLHFAKAKSNAKEALKIDRDVEQEFDAGYDKDPTRPMALVMINDGGETKIAGPLGLFRKLPHVTSEVDAQLRKYKCVNLSEVENSKHVHQRKESSKANEKDSDDDKKSIKNKNTPTKADVGPEEFSDYESDSL